jgi:hypothetical protein
MEHCKRRWALALTSAAMTLAWAGIAPAQVKRLETTEQGYEVSFRDGHLLGSADQARGWVLTLRKKQPRVLLIRPRASFVGEMLKSVEDM